jgi:hypothetical protein
MTPAQSQTWPDNHPLSLRHKPIPKTGTPFKE